MYILQLKIKKKKILHLVSPGIQVFMEHPMCPEEVRRKDQRLASQMRSCWE